MKVRIIAQGSYWSLFNPGNYETIEHLDEVAETKKIVVAGGLKVLFGQELRELSVVFK